MAWTLQGLLDAAGVTARTSGDAAVADLSYDSRAVRAGDLFCCIPGSDADGHSFAAGAVFAGASALLVERTLPLDVPQAAVDRVRPVLGRIADAFFGHPSQALEVAAVTGTNGKTTVTYLFEAMAQQGGRVSGIVGNVSRRYAGIAEPAERNTPEAIDIQRLLRRMADAGVDVVALEATSEGLVADRLRSTRFVTAGFTNLTQDHLNTHGTMEAYFDAKALLFDPSYTSRAVINIDDEYGRRLAEQIRAVHGGAIAVTTYGFANGDITCSNVELTSSGSRAVLHTSLGDTDIETSLVGRYNIANCMCAMGLALDCGIPLAVAAHGIATLDRVPGRLDSVQAGQPFLALVDYAHTPDALEQALGACRELASGRVIVVFGCGGDRDRAKRPLMGAAASRLADLSFITSDNPRSEDPDAIVADIVVGAKEAGGAFVTVVDRREAIAHALAEADEGDVVLIAGKGHEQGQYFADHTVPFDDRDVVRELLEALTCSR